MTIPYANSGALGANFSQVYTAPTTTTGLYPYSTDVPFALGTQVTATDGSVWIFVKYGTGGSTGLGYVCVYDEDFLAVMQSTSTGAIGDKIGVSPAAATINQYGWLQVFGVCDDIRVFTSCAANVALGSTANAGEIDDTVTTHAIAGIWLTTARGASQGNAPGVLNWPYVST